MFHSSPPFNLRVLSAKICNEGMTDMGIPETEANEAQLLGGGGSDKS